MHNRKFAYLALLTVILLAFSTIASAGTYTAVIAYGDSLSDNGNLYKPHGGTNPPRPVLDGKLFQRAGDGGITGQFAGLTTAGLRLWWSYDRRGNCTGMAPRLLWNAHQVPGMLPNFSVVETITPLRPLRCLWCGAGLTIF